jgi:hypothetical protein
MKATGLTACLVFLGLAAWLLLTKSSADPTSPPTNALSVDPPPPTPGLADPVVAVVTPDQQTNTIDAPAEAAGAEPTGDTPASAPREAAHQDWLTVVRTYVERTPAGNDLGLHGIVVALRNTMNREQLPEGPDPFAVTVPTVDELERDLEVNPLGRRLDDGERKQLAELLSDYRGRLRQHRRDTHLATMVNLGRAITAGDFVTVPVGQDNAETMQRLVKEAERDFPNPRDVNITSATGSDPSHLRLIILRPARYPDHARAVNDERVTKAELKIATRMFFLPAQRR